jgi:hypothetical protein
LFEVKGRDGMDTRLLNGFLCSDEVYPQNLPENVENDLIKSFQSGYSGLTISNIAEFFFEKDMRNVGIILFRKLPSG